MTRAVWVEYDRDLGPVWRRGFHDRFVRTHRGAEAIHRYIAENPARWPA